jgi:REP element-mobilizing transposase RayT
LRIEPGGVLPCDEPWFGTQKYFLEDKGRERFLKLLGETSRQRKVEIFAYCLLDNHYHILLQTLGAGLSRAMRQLDGIYTQGFNRAHYRDGPLFRGRYKTEIVSLIFETKPQKLRRRPRI